MTVLGTNLNLSLASIKHVHPKQKSRLPLVGHVCLAIRYYLDLPTTYNSTYVRGLAGVNSKSLVPKQTMLFLVRHDIGVGF